MIASYASSVNPIGRRRSRTLGEDVAVTHVTHEGGVTPSWRRRAPPGVASRGVVAGACGGV
jgi:hypothetical protein